MPTPKCDFELYGDPCSVCHPEYPPEAAEDLAEIEAERRANGDEGDDWYDDEDPEVIARDAGVL